MKSFHRKIWQRFPALLVLVGMLVCGSALYAQDTGVTVYKKDNLEVLYRASESGVSIDLVNRTAKELTNVELTSADIPNLKTAHKVLKVAKVPARSIQTFNVTYQLPGATDKNANTPPTSMRFLPRTGTMQLLYTGAAVLLLGLATGGVILVRKRKADGGKALMSLLLVGAVLTSVGIFPNRAAAAEKDRQVEVPISGSFKIGSHSFEYKGKLVFQIKDVKEVEETRTEVLQFAKKTELDKSLPVIKEDGSDNVSIKVKGVDGKKEILTKVTYVNGQKVQEEKISEKVLVQPVDEVTLMGGQAVERKKVLPFKTEYQPAEGAMAGSPNKLVREGVAGVVITTYTRAEDGSVKQSEQTTNPVNQVEAVANAKAQPAEQVPFKLVWQGDPDAFFDPDQYTVVKPGVAGEVRKVKLYKVDEQTGELGAAYADGKTIVDREATDELRTVGQLYKVRTELPYKEEKQEDASKPTGWQELVQHGKNGESVQTYRGKIDAATGQLLQTDKDEKVGAAERTEPQNKIVKVGTGKLETKEKTITEQIPFETVYEPVEHLPFGERQTTKKGKPGVKKTTVRVPWDKERDQELQIDGYEPEVVSTEVTDPVKEVIQIGVVRVQTEEFQADPVETELADKWGGWRKVTKPGAPGLKETRTRYLLDGGQLTDTVDGVPVVTEIKQAVPEEVEVGTDGRMDKDRAFAWLSAVREDRAEDVRKDLVLNPDTVREAEESAYALSQGKAAVPDEGKTLIRVRRADYKKLTAEEAEKAMEGVFQEILDYSPETKDMLLKGAPDDLGIAFYETKAGDLEVVCLLGQSSK